MTRPFHIALPALLALCAGCSAPAPPAPQPAADATPEAEPVADALEMSGIKLYLYNAAATPGVERSPSFSVEADKFTQDADRTWRFTQAVATVHAKSADESNIVFNAGAGQLREEESALLDGGVTAHVGPMTIQMDAIQWLQGADGTAGVASSDLPVSVVDTSLNLLAQQFRLYPANSQFALLEVQGEVAFAPPPTEGAQDAAAPQTEGAPAEAAPAPPQGEAPPS